VVRLGHTERAVAVRSCQTLGIMNLTEIVSTLESADDSLCIVAKRPWTGESEAKIVGFTEDFRIPEEALSAGYEYFLEVSTARDDVLSPSFSTHRCFPANPVVWLTQVFDL
jgi:hypothetical protein